MIHIWQWSHEEEAAAVPAATDDDVDHADDPDRSPRFVFFEIPADAVINLPLLVTDTLSKSPRPSTVSPLILFLSDTPSSSSFRPSLQEKHTC